MMASFFLLSNSLLAFTDQKRSYLLGHQLLNCDGNKEDFPICSTWKREVIIMRHPVYVICYIQLQITFVILFCQFRLRYSMLMLLYIIFYVF